MKAEVYWIPEIRAGRLAIMPRPRTGEWLEDEISSWKISGVDTVVSLLTLAEIRELGLEVESKVCNSHQIEFISYPISDRQTPVSSASMIDLVKKLCVTLDQGKGVAIHCRMGIGRSALVAASVLASQGMEVGRAFDVISRARGTQVPDTDEQKAWVGNLVGALRT